MKGVLLESSAAAADDDDSIFRSRSEELLFCLLLGRGNRMMVSEVSSNH